MAYSIKRVDPKLARENHMRLINNPFRYDAKTARSEMDLPGFSYSCFSRVGYINFWSLLKSMEALDRVFNAVSQEPRPMEKGVDHVVASQIVEVDPKLYEDAAIILPMTGSVRPAHVDDKSRSVYIELTNKVSGLRYVRCQRKVGLMHLKLKKGIPLPDDYKQFLEKVRDPSAEPVIIARQTAPENPLKFHMKVAHSDTDQLYHSNQACYFRYCLDAAADASNSDKLSNFHGDFFRYKVSHAEIVYRREIHPGDDLEVTFWEDQNAKDTLHFILSVNEDIKSIINLTFFQEHNSKAAKL